MGAEPLGDLVARVGEKIRAKGKGVTVPNAWRAVSRDDRAQRKPRPVPNNAGKHMERTAGDD